MGARGRGPGQEPRRHHGNPTGKFTSKSSTVYNFTENEPVPTVDHKSIRSTHCGYQTNAENMDIS